MRDLSPTKSADENRGYSGVLKWAMENKAIKNLAVSGPYGSGKSSIIQTFQQRYPEYHYLNISLASFKKEKEDQVELVLLSILQQIFYYVKGNSMPDSRYKRINPISLKALVFKSVMLVIWGLAICFVIKPDVIASFPEWTALQANHVWIRFLFLGVLFSGGVTIVYYFLKLYNNSQLSKLNIASGTLEVQQKSESSILNKHLDEILYFFEISKYDVVIIEDIDRFDNENTEIFTKLRELNTLINNAQQIGRHVVFVYAIRDEVFKNEDRTKFFDFILPVIPVINSSNSGDQLTLQLKEAGLSGIISGDFINKMSEHITDMRMLKNIMNEFLIYKNTIGSFEFEPSNLLGMLIYKNIEPEDFAELQGDKGIIFTFIRDRQTYNESLTVRLNERYSALQTEISVIENSAVSSVHELRSLYVFGFLRRLPINAAGQVDVGGGFLLPKELVTDVNFDLLRNANSISFQYFNPGSYSLQNKTINYNFSEVEDEVGHDQSYEQREKLIKIKAENRQEEKKGELQQVQDQINKIRFSKIKDLAKIKNLELINPKVAGKGLIIYLLENGYIDEHYRNYISYFYAESMTSADRDFILGVNYNRTMDISYKLEKVNEVIKSLSVEDFLKPQVLNITLLDFLLQDVGTYAEQLAKVFAQISNNKDSSKTVREKYLLDGSKKANFIHQLTKSWSKFWDYLQLESNYTTPVKLDYLSDILNGAELADILIQNQSGLLRTFISEMEDFQTFLLRLTNRVQTDKMLLALKVKFSNLPEVVDLNLFSLIHQNELYAVNPHMVNLVTRFAAEMRKKSLTDFKKGQYSAIKLFGDVKILNYLHKDIDSYLANVILKLPDNNEESESSMVELLNSAQITMEHKSQLIKQQEVRLQSLIVIQDPMLWPFIVEDNRMESTWPNVSDYQRQFDAIDEPLAGYLNRPEVYTALENQPFAETTEIGEDHLEAYYEEIVTSTYIKDEVMTHLLKAIPFSFPEIDLAGVSEARVDMLMDLDFLALSRENYDLLKTSHDGKNIVFLEHFYPSGFEWWNSITYEVSDYKRLFVSQVFTLADKFSLAESMPLELLRQDGEIADLLARLYSSSTAEMPDELFNEIISNASEETWKVKVAVQQKDNFSASRYKEVLQYLGEKYDSILAESKFATLSNVPHNKLLADLLVEKGLISSVTRLDKPDLRLNMTTNVQ